jgi:hypothetical protein
MADLTETLLPGLLAHHLPGLDLDATLQVPVYDGDSLANIAGSVCHWLGLQGWLTTPLNDVYTHSTSVEYDQVILLVVDGMGLELFQRLSREIDFQPWQELLQASNLYPLTSVVPSTTAAALTAFWTGCTPAQHGILGYEIWLREFNLAANMITHMPAFFDGPVGSLSQTGFDPHTFLSVPTLGPFLKHAGVETLVLQHNSIARSGLSTMLFDQTQAVPFRGMNDMFTTLAELACQDSHQKRFLYAYWGDLDELQHVYGPQNLRIGQEFHNFQQALCRLAEILKRQTKRKTLLLVTADHGQSPSLPDVKYLIKEAHEFVNCLHLLPTGESRLPYLHIRPGCEERIRGLVEELWPGDFQVIRSAEAITAGLFGPRPYHPELESRVGDLVLVARNEGYLYWPNKENKLHGRHGGLSRAEMLIPLLMFEC